MEENRDKIDNDVNKKEETEENEQKINNDCNCGCEHCETEGCSKDDCKECDCRGEHCEPEKDELTLANEKIKDWEDKYKRLLAEFDNFRKRSEKESAQMCDIGASVVLTKILPIVDNIERALQNIPEDIKDNTFVEGIDKTYKQILKTFEDMDVKPIESVGKPFDANLHNAVMTDENAEGEVDTVVEELQKRYMYKDQVLRHSMVKVKK